MSESYRQLLDATIQHVEDLKARGVRHLAVAPETLRAFTTAAPRLSVPMSDSRSRQREEAPTEESAIRNPQSAINSGRLMPVVTNTGSSPVQSATSIPQSAMEKAAAFTALRERAMACVKCPHLASSRKNVVFGVGSLDAQLMFVGEAPGADEDESGEPFVGKAGQLLTKIIETTGLSRADVYIANILKCRPDTPGQSAGNRKPTSEEMATCIPYLHEQIDLIRPKVIVALGATAVEGLLGKTVGITKLRGNWQTYRDTPLMPTYHPAYLLRNQSLATKREVWEDMLAVMERLAMPTSEKQRNFFLKG
jgi:DNA polymerase